jgi:hypothetical protein
MVTTIEFLLAKEAGVVDNVEEYPDMIAHF